MRILHVTPGAGDGYDCENCLRDNSLIWALKQAGHDVEQITLYLPPKADRPEEQPAACEIFYGGLNVYLQQKSSLFRSTPRLVDALFDWQPLLRWASRKSHLTTADDLGQTAMSMLEGEQGRQAKELERLIAHLRTLPRPDVISLSNLLISGLAPRLRQELQAPVVCLLQDEDYFLDDLGEHSGAAWSLVRQRAGELDACIAVSRYYAGVMRERLELADDRLHVAHSAIFADDWPEPAEPATPTLTFVSPLNERGGADLLVEAWGELLARHPGLALRVVGIKRIDPDYRARLQARIDELAAASGGDGQITVAPARDQRMALMAQATLLAVPTRHPEAFGRYVLEALAAGVPVVLPDHGGFTELVQETGGGALFPPGDLPALTRALDDLLTDHDKRRALGLAGRAAVRERFGLPRFAADVAAVLERVVQPNPTQPAPTQTAESPA